MTAPTIHPLRIVSDLLVVELDDGFWVLEPFVGQTTDDASACEEVELPLQGVLGVDWLCDEGPVCLDLRRGVVETSTTHAIGSALLVGAYRDFPAAWVPTPFGLVVMLVAWGAPFGVAPAAATRRFPVIGRIGEADEPWADMPDGEELHGIPLGLPTGVRSYSFLAMRDDTRRTTSRLGYPSRVLGWELLRRTPWVVDLRCGPKGPPSDEGVFMCPSSTLPMPRDTVTTNAAPRGSR